ncbi:hypothetical protein GBAR_LOCUS9413 [Geodia barretti]|uniref:Uncharacterized protein n=2 Tax=Geodia barretti TaxID=519541 RepID=A0AA35RP28_GEOBA|nr:hypothetical protein GBAR_LOCUS9413 [Geodia barretti]
MKCWRREMGEPHHWNTPPSSITPVGSWTVPNLTVRWIAENPSSSPLVRATLSRAGTKRSP